MNKLSQEVRVLNCVAELIENSVNHLVCCFSEDRGGFVNWVSPKGIIEQNYFFILLLEIFSPVNPNMIPGKEKNDNLLTLIQKISKEPCLHTNQNNSSRMGRRASEFLDWLNQEFDIPIYSAEIGKNINLNISRKDALYLVGNRCKHTLVRSDAISEKLARKYRDSGITVSVEEETLLLQDIDDWFFDDFCIYHFTKICELYSNLYYSIIVYVRPVYESSSIFKDGVQTVFKIPSELTRPDYSAEFRSLINKVRNTWIPLIQTSETLIPHY